MVRPQGRQTRAVASVTEASAGGVRRGKLYGGGHQATDISVEGAKREKQEMVP